MSKESISENKSTIHMGYEIKEIRFLPMSKEIFPTYADVSEFLRETLPNRGGIYYYRTLPMKCQPNTLVLFQYKGQLIGSAISLLWKEYDKPCTLNDGVDYNGSYSFAINSIQLFRIPIEHIDYRTINPNAPNRFGQGKHIVPMEYLAQIIELIESRKPIKTDVPVILPEEVMEDVEVFLKEGAKQTITINAYERNSQAREKCISHYKKKNNGIIKCEICGFDFGKVYGEQFSDKIHVHHLLELSAIGEEYEVDPINDLLPVCPNCHLIAHSRTPAYTPSEIKKMLKKD